MPRPFDYSSAIINPTASFLGNLQVLQQMEQQEAAQRQVEQRNNILRSLMSKGTGATAEDYVQASLALPEDRELFKQSWDMLDEGKKNALFKGGSEAYMLADSDPEGAAGRLEEYATGFENAGDEQAAKQFRDAAKIVRTDPEAAKTTIGMMLSFADGERFKNVAGRDPAQDTALIKNLVAEGLEPGTEEFQAAVREERRKVSFFHPDFGFVSGSPEFVQDIFGGSPPEDAEEIPRIGSKEEAERLPPGAQFIGPDGKLYRKPGGASGNTGGGFRPVSNAVSVMREVLPGATITSGYRGPNHPLSKANPRSFHTKTRAAVDIAPIKGMTFAQAAKRLREAGYYVHPDSRDEVKNPSSHATGPHWHFVIGDR